jgi:lipopolysaccharide export system protein LptA
LAVFKGNVRAAQGAFVVRTAELRARYTGAAGLAEPMGATTKRQPAQLNRVEARGKVIVTSKDGQSATGDWANFDVRSNKVTLGGDVVLTQDKNIVRGTRLVIDMATGQSIIQNDPAAAGAKAAEAIRKAMVRARRSANAPARLHPRRKTRRRDGRRSPQPGSARDPEDRLSRSRRRG